LQPADYSNEILRVCEQRSERVLRIPSGVAAASDLAGKTDCYLSGPSPDGQRFLVSVTERPGALTVLLNWPALIQR
jgi:hypothetical protein